MYLQVFLRGCPRLYYKKQIHAVYNYYRSMYVCENMQKQQPSAHGHAYISFMTQICALEPRATAAATVFLAA